MLQVQRGIDGLRHCLCPVLSRCGPTSVGSISKLTAKSFKRGLLNQDGIAPYCSVLRGLPRNQNSLSTPNSGFRSSHSFRLVRQDPLEVPREHNLRDLRDSSHGPVLPQLGNDALYTELQYAALKGDFLRVYCLVEALVKERGEEPNLQLYLSMVLANTNPQHGSPAEVKRLLEEIASEGLVPDSSIYHAVLKVNSMAGLSCRLLTDAW